MPFNFYQTNFIQTETFKILLDQTVLEMAGEHYQDSPRGLIRLTEEGIINYKNYLINYHGSAEYNSVNSFFRQIIIKANTFIKNSENKDVKFELEMFKIVMRSCQENINYELLENQFERLRLEKEEDDHKKPGF